MSKIAFDIKIDAHCHSIASCHAMCTITELIKLAKEKGMSGIVLADHHPSLRWTGPDYFIDAPDDAYFHVFSKRYQCQDPQLKVYKSIEINFLDQEPWISKISPLYGQGFDLVLAGVHTFPHLFLKHEDPLLNTEFLLNTIELGSQLQPFDIFTHPIMQEVPFEVEPVVEACVKREIALELNNSYLRYRPELLPKLQEMVGWVNKKNGWLSVGSDAHLPNELGLLSEASAFLQALDFPAERIVNLSIAQFETFLEIRRKAKNKPLSQ